MAAAGFGFPRQHRLLSQAEFQFVFEQAHKSADGMMTVLARRSDLGHARLGLAISKKHIRHAVDRNRIKRLVRESFRLRQAGLGSVDFVVMARKPALLADSDSFCRALDKHWKILIKRCDSR